MGEPAPGDVFLTAFGVATIIGTPYPPHDGGPRRDGGPESAKDYGAGGPHSFRVRLWRRPGASIGSSATAHLRRDAMIKRLPAAPGMKTSTDPASGGEGRARDVMVHCYSPAADSYVVSQIGGETVAGVSEDGGVGGSKSIKKENVPAERNLLVVRSSELRPAKCAKFYPLIDELMRRGDEAARASTALLGCPQMDSVFDSIESSVEGVSNGPLSPEKVDAVTKSVHDVVPTSKEINEIYAMLKDEELTVLLERGRERLRQLVSRDIPKAKKAALHNIGIEIEQSAKSAVELSRERALEALDQLLAEHVHTDIQKIRQTLGDHFSAMFDLMNQAARSDRNLSSIFDAISAKTSLWQEHTGRLLKTRSVSVFIEGSQRLQARATKLCAPQPTVSEKYPQNRLTKAFTEGDVAVARLKSIELGEAVRARLFKAIETRSESQGGLDGIIAGAFTTMNSNDLGEEAQKKLNSTLAGLQNSAPCATKNARETLISLISDRSEYQELALLRIEEVLIELESQLGDDITAEELASIARGDGGTASVFEPIARRAAKEIERQLDSAEKAASDPTALTVLSHVRRIVSGDLTIAGLLDELTNVLNDDKVATAGENLIKQGEMVLDALEGSSSTKSSVDGVIKAAEKAGITKEAVMGHMEKMDMNSILSTAEGAVTDEKARTQLLSDATDSALDFLLRILPSMPVPPFDGVRDGLLYHLSNLSLEGFKVKKEDINVEIAGIRAARAFNNSADECKSDNRTQTDGIEVETNPLRLLSAKDTATGLSREQRSTSGVHVVASGISSEEKPAVDVAKETEILCINVRNISAVLDNAVWSFEQTYMPYLRGNGMASARLWGGSMCLRFALRRKKASDSDEWEPVLCLHDRNCIIEEVDLQLQGEGKLTWIVNKLAVLFKNPLRDYVVRVIVDALTNRSGWLLGNLNTVLAPYWGLILRTSNLTMDDLAEVSAEDIVKATPDPYANLVDLVWRERVPLGINLLLNDESGFIKVVEFPRGSQARKVAQAKDLDPDLFKGATIVAVDGTRFQRNAQSDAFSALKETGRPKTINFLLASVDEARRVKDYVEGKNENKPFGDITSPSDTSSVVNTVVIHEKGHIGLRFAKSLDDFSIYVRGFNKSCDGQPAAAERTGKISLGDILSHVQGQVVLGDNGAGWERALSILEASKERPLSLGFVKPYLSMVVFQKSDLDIGGPEELVFEEKKTESGSTRIVLKGFRDMDGVAESSGVFLGDHLVFVNGVPVGAGCRFTDSPPPQLQEVIAMLQKKENYPIALTFARPRQTTNRWSTTHALDVGDAVSFCVTAMNYEHIGFELRIGRDRGEILVKSFHAVKGIFQKKMNKQLSCCRGLSLDCVDGEVVPSYATGKMVMNAVKRSWKNGKVELLFCHDIQREWVRNLASSSEEEGAKK